jgi:hypothetical protein
VGDAEPSGDELERLRRIETAAAALVEVWSSGKRGATPLLEAMAELRAALKPLEPRSR